MTPTLHTDRLRLRPVTDSDADDLFALHSSAVALRYWDAPAWTDRSRADLFIARSREMADEGSGVRLVVTRAADGTFLTDTRNAASARVLEKLGFLREGTLREDCVVDGEVSDSWVHGLLRREWPPLRAGHPPARES